MDSVYDAARAYAEKLKAELETLQTFLNLHDHFQDHFGLTPATATRSAETRSAETRVAPAEVEAPVADQAGATHAIHVRAPDAEVPDAEAEAAIEGRAPEVEASGSQESQQTASLNSDAAMQAEEEPLVIKASEGVLIATPDAAETEPLGAEATLQSVAEKLAATIGASHPAVTGYTV